MAVGVLVSAEHSSHKQQASSPPRFLLKKTKNKPSLPPPPPFQTRSQSLIEADLKLTLLPSFDLEPTVILLSQPFNSAIEGASHYAT